MFAVDPVAARQRQGKCGSEPVPRAPLGVRRGAGVAPDEAYRDEAQPRGVVEMAPPEAGIGVTIEAQRP